MNRNLAIFAKFWSDIWSVENKSFEKIFDFSTLLFFNIYFWLYTARKKKKTCRQ
jgi:hypothetical protein